MSRYSTYAGWRPEYNTSRYPSRTAFMSRRSRTARPLTNQNCRSEVARAADGAPIQPEMRTGPAE